MRILLSGLGQWLSRVALCLVLLASIGLDIDEMSEGEVPFFNDEGSLTLPDASSQDFEESMPELQLFNPRFARKLLKLPAPKAPALSP